MPSPSWPDPHGPAEDLVPWDAQAVTPTDDEQRVWRTAMMDCYSVLRWLPPPNLRVIWFRGGDPRLFGQTMMRCFPPVVLLRAGRRLEDLRKTAFHELRHMYQASFSEDAWALEKREADAEAFATRMTAR